MPANPKPGTRTITVELPISLIDAMDALADASRRTRRAEWELAAERHLAAPPIITIPPLPAPAQPKKPKKK